MIETRIPGVRLVPFSADEPQPLAYGIHLDDQVVGRVELLPAGPQRYDATYSLDESATGRGIATAALDALVEYAARERAAYDVRADVAHGNHRGEAVLRRSGFVVEDDFDSHRRWHRGLTVPEAPGRGYVPRFNAMAPERVRGFVARTGTAQLVTVDQAGIPDATLLPVLWRGDRLIGHFARANDHWRRVVDGSDALAVVAGPDAYVTPDAYATKREHGRVVPTWNYVTAHLRGSVRVVDDPDWVRDVVTSLTQHHEAGRPTPWRVDDAPDRYVEKQLRAIVGVELTVTSVDAKAKLSQNRSAEDRAGVLADLGEHPVAAEMRR